MILNKWFARVAMSGVFVAALVALPAPAMAQIGALAGKVVDGEGKPVADVQIIFDNASMGQHLETKTNKKGEWTLPGMMLAGTGGASVAWKGVAKKDTLEAPIHVVEIRMNSVTETPTVTLAPAKGTKAANLGNAADAAKKAQLDKVGIDIAAAWDASDWDTAIAKLTEASTLVDKCVSCFTKIGDAYMKKGDNIKAQEAYEKAIALDETSAADAYDGLAGIYNTQRKFDEAAKASQKAMDLRTAKSGGVVDPEAEYNAAVIAFNQTKIPEARTHLEKVLQLKPDHAEAHYLYGMVLINQNKIPEAKKELQKYLELAPTGPNAEMAKAIVAAQ